MTQDEYIIDKVKAYNISIINKENNKTEQEFTINDDLTKELKLITINKLSLTISYEKAPVSKNVRMKKK